MSHNKIGDVLVAQGDRPGALAPTRSLAIAERWRRAIPPTPNGSATSRSATTRSATCWWRRATGPARWPPTAGPGHRRGAGGARSGQHRVAARPLGQPRKIGDVKVSQGDLPGALAAYRGGRWRSRERLAARDPANSGWQTDVAVSCAKLGTLAHGQSVEVRHTHLVRGRQILVSLKCEGHLMASQDWIPWFDEQLAKLTGGPSSR